MTLNDLKLRARALLRPNRVEQELEEELAFHIEREARKLLAEGITPTESLAAALATAVLATPFGALISQIVHVTDPVAYLASLGLIVAVCLLAAWIPAARAAKVDPMRTLRQA
jgi:ABC-type lipoprotein release transport system permease subunit